jgi:NADP-dependent 3-hydroxy acid dehydrogenase YdfG
MNIFPIPLEDKVVLITGASSGFGEDAAWRFVAEGCKVVLAARRIDRLQMLASRIQDEGGEAIAVPMDIVNPDDIDNMVKSALDLYGQIDILFNNAGIGRVAWFEEHSLERDIDLLIRVNLIGMMQVTRTVLPHMIQRREGHIINMISVAGLISPPLIAVIPPVNTERVPLLIRSAARLRRLASRSAVFIPVPPPPSLAGTSEKTRPMVPSAINSNCA